jgi:hypothetical protein
MKRSFKCILFTLFALGVHTLNAAGDFSIKASTPVGSWQLRQEIHTEPNGKQSLLEVKTSLVGKEKRDNIEHVWIEMATQAYDFRKGNKGKASGERTILKILMEAKSLEGKPEDIVNNMRGMGKEMILQSGENDPIAIEEGGMMGGALLQAMGTEINYQFKELGKETVETQAGKIKAKVIEGAGSVEMKVVFKTMKVDGTTKQWITNEVPFGMVKMESTSTVSGKTSKVEGILLSFGKSGAVSEIKGTPQAVQLPGLGSLFGN